MNYELAVIWFAASRLCVRAGNVCKRAADFCAAKGDRFFARHFGGNPDPAAVREWDDARRERIGVEGKP
jgi:hypothetical protein